MSKEKTLKQKLADLEALVTWFDSEDVDVEEAITKFDEGSKLADEIRDDLKTLENKITILKKRFDEAE